MLAYVFEEIRFDGRFSVILNLPCFIGDGSDFSSAARMNRFYEAAAGEMYRYAHSFPSDHVRRMSYLCCSCVEISEDEVVTVTMDLILRRLLIGESCPTLRKQLIHRWKNGVLMKK